VCLACWFAVEGLQEGVDEGVLVVERGRAEGGEVVSRGSVRQFSTMARRIGALVRHRRAPALIPAARAAVLSGGLISHGSAAS
jgi:hypothetical protein